MKKKFDVILFDMDGTTVDTDQMIIETFNRLYDLYKDGKRRPKEEIYPFSGPLMKETLKTEFPHMDNEFMMNEYRRISFGLYEGNIKPIEGCVETLNILKENGVRLGIVTNKSKLTADMTIDLVKYHNLFEVMITCDDVNKSKPDKEGIIKALDLMNYSNKERVLYVGDNIIDDISAKNAGVKSAIIYFGPRHIPDDLKPDIKLYKFKDLLKEILYE